MSLNERGFPDISSSFVSGSSNSSSSRQAGAAGASPSDSAVGRPSPHISARSLQQAKEAALAQQRQQQYGSHYQPQQQQQQGGGRFQVPTAATAGGAPGSAASLPALVAGMLVRQGASLSALIANALQFWL
jgi:hypothetical protein